MQKTSKFSIRFVWYTFILFFVFFILSGCVSHFIASQMIAAPNQNFIGDELKRQFSAFDAGHQAMLKIDGVSKLNVDLPSQNLRMTYIDIEARDYGFTYQTSALRTESGMSYRIDTHWRWDRKDCQRKENHTADGKVLLLLHGWGRNSLSMLSYGLAFAQQGYRVIIPDLRGHGLTTGDWVSFGEQEGEDIRALVDALNIQFYDIVGFSLGATTGIHVAAKDSRAEQSVFIAPMHSLEQTIPKFVKQSPRWLGNIISFYQNLALQKVNDIGGFDYQHSSNTILPAKNIKNAALFVYGEVDVMSGVSLNKLLASQSSQENKLAQLAGLRHTHVLLHQSALMQPIAEWLKFKPKNRSKNNQYLCHKIDFEI